MLGRMLGGGGVGERRSDEREAEREAETGWGVVGWERQQEGQWVGSLWQRGM